jgi:hypothetical protein
MSHFAQVIDGIVQQVIVVEQDVLDTGAFGDPSQWIQTSYNTRAGQHLQGGTPLRKNYAGIGFVYDAERDAFYAPQPFPSWTLDEASCLWFPPITRPADDQNYLWNETTLTWDLI